MENNKSLASSLLTLKAWWQAARPPFYIATLIPVLLGFSLAVQNTGRWDLAGLSGIMLICLFQHLASNLANDLFDHILGVDTAESIGGSRVIQEGKITTRALGIALVVLYSLTVLGTFIGVAYFGRPALWLVSICAMFSSFFYVAPPIRYGHRALGELAVFLNMGLLMTAGTYYAIAGGITVEIIALSVPVGLMVAGILYYQSMPEIELDKAAGKRTLANTLGGVWSIHLLAVWWPIVWGVMFLLWFWGFVSGIVFVGIALSVPLYLKLMHLVRQAKDNWILLDNYGGFVRKMYLVCGLSLIFSVIY